MVGWYCAGLQQPDLGTSNHRGVHSMHGMFLLVIQKVFSMKSSTFGYHVPCLANPRKFEHDRHDKQLLRTRSKSRWRWATETGMQTCMHIQYQTIGAIGPLGIWGFYMLGLVVNFVLASSTVATARKKQQVRRYLRSIHEHHKTCSCYSSNILWKWSWLGNCNVCLRKTYMLVGASHKSLIHAIQVWQETPFDSAQLDAYSFIRHGISRACHAGKCGMLNKACDCACMNRVIV